MWMSEYLLFVICGYGSAHGRCFEYLMAGYIVFALEKLCSRKTLSGSSARLGKEKKAKLHDIEIVYDMAHLDMELAGYCVIMFHNFVCDISSIKTRTQFKGHFLRYICADKGLLCFPLVDDDLFQKRNYMTLLINAEHCFSAKQSLVSY
ncbi:unnamed protein product [Vicia faba]|uniref:Uncharacterized protein n=1 Tax=Vicia faba TaxID=3906 RepID=A0AAV0Z315_VICFA|nr:unnamed protein product [Vicia faba]